MRLQEIISWLHSIHFQVPSTVPVDRMAHRKWKEMKQQPSILPDPAVPGCNLVSFHFLWAILSTGTVQIFGKLARFFRKLTSL